MLSVLSPRVCMFMSVCIYEFFARKTSFKLVGRIVELSSVAEWQSVSQKGKENFT